MTSSVILQTLFPLSLRRSHHLSKPTVFRFCTSSSLSSTNTLNKSIKIPQQQQQQNVFLKKEDSFDVQVRAPFPSVAKLSLSNQAFFLLIFIACTATTSFVGFVMAAVPTLYAISRTAIAVAKLADTAREELPSTMGAVRLSGMEISELTLELSDLSHEISDGVYKSAQAVKAAEAGVRQIGSLAQHKTMSMIEERANLPEISIKPVVVGVAKQTSQAVGHAGKTFMNMLTGNDSSVLGETAYPRDTSDI